MVQYPKPDMRRLDMIHNLSELSLQMYCTYIDTCCKLVTMFKSQKYHTKHLKKEPFRHTTSAKGHTFQCP